MAILYAALLPVCAGGCHSHGQSQTDGGGAAGSDGGGDGAGGTVVASPVIISVATPRPRTGSWSVNYWTWPAAYGNSVAGTETLVAALAPTFMRVGGYNNDANTPNAFDDTQVDAMIAYARAIGAEPILQVPLLADNGGQPPTAATAAAMVTYANVTKGYGIKYFSIGNEPDLYPTSGLPSDGTQPARPGYTPMDFCSDATAFVTAMKNVDSTIQIVGPDLSYQYQPFADWLTPILRTCGDLFDVVAVHRYPFSSDMATLPAAMGDAETFRALVPSLRNIMQATGHGDKPLGITEMNIAYNATTTVIGASPGTVASGLWLADIVGSSLDLGLWTVAQWDISDPDQYSLGLLGLPPAHTPRPEYYAYALYAAHFGPTLVDVTSAPANVRAYATRNAAGTATEVIAINWNSASAPLAFEITGLPSAPPPAIFELPALSMAAVEIPDDGTKAPAASVYGGAQHTAGAGPQPLAPGTGTVADGGTSGGGADAAPLCPSIPPPSATITTQGTGTGAALTFGAGSAQWGSYVYAAPGQPSPVATATADGNGIEIVDSFSPADGGGNYAGVGLYFMGTNCLDASTYTGIKFDFAGDLGGCALALGSASSADLDRVLNVGRGTCSAGATGCYGPSAAVTPGTTTVMVPFNTLAGGMPVGALDPANVVTVQWQLAPPASGTCAAHFTVSNVAFY
ncbi:MAG TPA: hypothetical protein VLU24_06195 [Mycobacterium sp.]|nr:hypothetical protein [Mycobacterium sp.]